MAPLRATLTIACGITATLAEFTSSFGVVAQGSSLEIKWEKLADESTPAYLSGRIFNETEDGVVFWQTNLSTDLSGTSFTWENIPSPLPYIPNAEYELELLSQNPSSQEQAGSGPTLGKSGLFSIRQSGDEGQSSDQTTTSGPQTTPTVPKSRGGPSKPVIITAVCVGLGVPTLIGVVVWIGCARKQRRRREYEENRRLRYRTIID